MKWFKNMKMGGKLIITFAVMLVLAAEVGIYNVEWIKKLRTDYGEIFELYGNSQGYLGFVLANFEEQRACLANVNVERSVEYTKETQAKLKDKLDPELNNSLSLFKDTCVGPEAQAEYQKIDTLITSFRNLRDEAMGIAAAGEFDAYRELLAAPDTNAAVEALGAILDQARETNLRQATEVFSEKEKSVLQVITFSIVSMIFEALAAVVMIILVSRSITRPLKRVSETAAMLAEGNTNISYNGFIAKDEIGLLEVNLNNMVQAVHNLVEDMKLLNDAAAAGELSTRADASRHKGEYASIIEGVNTTLDTMTAPVLLASQSLSELAEGNLAVRVDGNFLGDHAQIQNALNHTVTQIRSYIQQITDVLSSMAGGDFTVSIQTEFKGDFIHLKNAINTIIHSLNDVLQNIDNAAEQVTVGTRQVSDSSQTVSQGATQQASAIQELTATVTEIAEQIRMSAENAGEVNKSAISTRDKAAEGTAHMKSMQDAMAEINGSSANISKIIKVIDDIAFQTNILALNAAVEAARAGEHGKGFAVVAEEVRNLAAKSASAARETTELIESSIQKTETGTKIANSTANTLNEIVLMVGGAVEALGGIAVASNEQAMGVAQINKGIEQLSQVVQSNSATSEQTAAAAEELSGQADLLKQLVSHFKLKKDAPVRPQLALNDGEYGRKLLEPESRKSKYEIPAVMDAKAYQEDTDIIVSDTEFGKY